MVGEYAKVASLSYFILFIDLVQAYDRVVRVIVFGWPQPAQGETEMTTDRERLEYLCRIGVNKEAAHHIVKEVRESGTVMERWQVDPIVAELIRGLPSKAWFQVA